MSTPEDILAAQKKAAKEEKVKENENPLMKTVEALSQQVSQLVGMRKLDEETLKRAKEKSALEVEAKEKQELEANADLKKLLDEVEPEEDKGYESLNNKEMIEVLSTALNSSLDARMKGLSGNFEDKLKVLVDSGDQTKKAVLSLIAKMNVDATVSSHDDFNDYREEIAGVMKKYPGIEIEDAYKLAKFEKVSKLPPKKELVSERPDRSMLPLNTSLGHDERGKIERGNEYKSQKRGLADFRDFTDVALDKVLAKRNA